MQKSTASTALEAPTQARTQIIALCCRDPCVCACAWSRVPSDVIGPYWRAYFLLGPIALNTEQRAGQGSASGVRIRTGRGEACDRICTVKLSTRGRGRSRGRSRRGRWRERGGRKASCRGGDVTACLTTRQSSRVGRSFGVGH